MAYPTDLAPYTPKIVGNSFLHTDYNKFAAELDSIKELIGIDATEDTDALRYKVGQSLRSDDDVEFNTVIAKQAGATVVNTSFRSPEYNTNYGTGLGILKDWSFGSKLGGNLGSPGSGNFPRDNRAFHWGYNLDPNGDGPLDLTEPAWQFRFETAYYWAGDGNAGSSNFTASSLSPSGDNTEIVASGNMFATGSSLADTYYPAFVYFTTSKKPYRIISVTNNTTAVIARFAPDGSGDSRIESGNCQLIIKSIEYHAGPFFHDHDGGIRRLINLRVDLPTGTNSTRRCITQFFSQGTSGFLALGNGGSGSFILRGNNEIQVNTFDIYMNTNNKHIWGRESGGTYRHLLGLNNSEQCYLGDANSHLFIACSRLGFFGATPVIKQAHIDDPSGGTPDAEARTAIAAILDALETYGLLATS